MDFKNLEEKKQLELLIEISQKVYKAQMERFSREGLEISNVAYSKTTNGEVVFEVEISNGVETFREYYTQDLEIIMAENAALKQNIINEKRVDLEDTEKQEQFKEEIKNSEERVDAKAIIGEKNKKIDACANELGIDSKEIQITEVNEDTIEKADEELDKNSMKLEDKQIEKIENNSLVLDGDEKITERMTANKTIGGEYSKYLFVRSNGSYTLLGEKTDGTIEKINNVMNLRPHIANVVGADGEFNQTQMETGFMIKGQTYDIGFGITTEPNGIPKITYMRGYTNDNPIGYNIKDKTTYKQSVNDKIRNIFDERITDKSDVKDISEGLDRIDETPEEDRLNVNDFGEDNGIYYDDLAAEYDVSIEDVQKLDEQLLEEGYYNADTRLNIIKETLEEEKENDKEEVEEEIEEDNKIDHGEREILPPDFYKNNNQ